MTTGTAGDKETDAMGDGNLSKRERREQNRARARRKQVQRTAAWAVAAVAVLAVSVAFVTRPDPGAASGVTTDVDGWVLPAMGQTAASQDTVALADFAGQPAVVNFFASWCTACDAELPAFVSVTEQLRDRVQFVGIASQETGDPMFMPNRHGLDGLWPLARDAGPGGGGLSRGLGARGMPVTAFYDSDGSLLRQHVGAMTEGSLLATISELFGITPDA